MTELSVLEQACKDRHEAQQTYDKLSVLVMNIGYTPAREKGLRDAMGKVVRADLQIIEECKKRFN